MREIHIDNVIWRCQSCFWWETDLPKGSTWLDCGECRVLSPTPAQDPIERARWPLTNKDDWCALFKYDAS